MNLANNHAFDFGATGLGQTVTALGRHRVKVTGRPGEITVLAVDGAKVAFVGFAAYPWAFSITDLAGVRALIHSLALDRDGIPTLTAAGVPAASSTSCPAKISARAARSCGRRASSWPRRSRTARRQACGAASRVRTVRAACLTVSTSSPTWGSSAHTRPPSAAAS